jgi:large subunit ribosomal protein L30e
MVSDTELVQIIQAALKEGGAIIGYKMSVKFLKTGSPRMVVLANNTPESMRREMEHNAKVSNVPVENFNGTSKDLGLVCGKPFPITAITIKR